MREFQDQVHFSHRAGCQDENLAIRPGRSLLTDILS